ncbi:exopolyphosphatase [Capsulimonas corticalis]|uniref:Exopolyphosphatase n=1 Tax=Capsulimonas corticalis TaxID=2219043 RepID=A0A402CPF0_9BACT|nr:exopolyphosphatase [Capsulimonas corticalis]BDI33067.1 exopolyphosphatase [Capsulimonas corticalis]
MRLVTRSDFDGLICAVLLKQVEQVDSIKFVHPKDLQDGAFEVEAQDILANVPYVPGCCLWFDHHATEIARVVGKQQFVGECRLAPSAARVIYDYYGGASRFPGIEEMMFEVDKADSAQFSRDEILNPKGWALLSFVMDARTGLGRFKDYRISNYQLMYELIDACMTMTIDEILNLSDVQERVVRYFEQDVLFREMLQKHTWTEGDTIVTDLREVDPIFCGNRFLVYAMWPKQNISIWIVNGFRNQNCVFACGHSIVNRSSEANVGAVMRAHGGGGHAPAGTCQVAHEDFDATLKHIVSEFNAGKTAELQKAA